MTIACQVLPNFEDFLVIGWPSQSSFVGDDMFDRKTKGWLNSNFMGLFLNHLLTQPFRNFAFTPDRVIYHGLSLFQWPFAHHHFFDRWYLFNYLGCSRNTTVLLGNWRPPFRLKEFQGIAPRRWGLLVVIAMGCKKSSGDLRYPFLRPFVEVITQFERSNKHPMSLAKVGTKKQF